MAALTFLTLVLVLGCIQWNTWTWNHQQIMHSILNPKMHSSDRRPLYIPASCSTSKAVCILTILLSGDVAMNPGPRNKQSTIYPCGLCEHPVTWDHKGVCCDGCDVWHHQSCIELCTYDYELLERSNVQWLCCKCESINVTTFTFRSYEIHLSNIYEPLSYIDSSFDSIRTEVFSPLKTSSPKQNNNSKQNTTNGKRGGSKTSTTTEGDNPYSVPKKQNLRILTINCRSIKDKSQELTAAIEYLKPDIVCGTESWLKGIKPGKNPTSDAIRSSEIFPPNYNVYRNDRGTLGGGVFIMVNKQIISEEQPELVTNCEIEWVKIKSKNNKDILISSFYMPQRNKQDLQELEKSLEKATNTNNKTIILAGDFNCPDIDWEQMSTKQGNDRDVQQQLIDITNMAGLSQIHEQPTRGENMLDLVFVSNPSLMKSSVSVPGISDHDIVVTDFETKPYYQKTPSRKCYIYGKVNWDQLNKSLENMSKTSSKCITKERTYTNCRTHLKLDYISTWKSQYHPKKYDLSTQIHGSLIEKEDF